MWNPNGRELFYISPDQQMMVMPVPAGPVFQVSVPRPLFPVRVSIPSGPRNHYSVTPDGSSFYVVSPLGGQTTNLTTVVINWPSDIAAR
jgi:DNA-binding helix-hairpin-helix protein with protein kinase domain